MNMEINMKKIICWGAGKQAETILKTSILEIYEILYFVDIDKNRWGEQIGGFKINNPSIITNNIEKYDNIVITTRYWMHVFEECIKMEVCLDKIKYFDIEDFKIKDILEMYSNKVFSQEGEEIYLREKFRNKDKGIYVDVGAFHPFKFSNTYWAYKLGWKGINIEPNYENYKLFCVLRPKDTNINCGISNKNKMLQYYLFEEGALNTFSKKEIKNIGDVQKIEMIQVKQLKEVLLQEDIQKIDFINIDVEGMEMEVLESIDWEEVDINCILVEQRNKNLLDILQTNEYFYLKEKGYEATNKYGRTTIYEKI